MFVTSVSSPSPVILRPSSESVFLSSSSPHPVFAEIGRTLFVKPLSTRRETIPFPAQTFLLHGDAPEASSVTESNLFTNSTNFFSPLSFTSYLTFEDLSSASISSVILSILEIYSASSRTASSPRDKSVIPNTISASFIFLNVLSIPIFSTTSSVSRMPAVSMKRKSTPPMLSVSSTVSRVVPATSETIARSSPKRAFSSVLFPVFVAPAITTGTPFLIALPRLKESLSLFICSNDASTRAHNSFRLANSTSSSLKSSSSSNSEVIFSSSPRSFFNSAEKPPFN